MTELPLWAAIAVAFFLILGAGLTLIGSIGLLRLRSFYDRLHAPTLGTSWGALATILASVIFFSISERRLVLHDLVIGFFIMCTTPVTLMLLGRAALYRDRSENTPVVTPSDTE
ncbi:monovalent cation/H(+) antiporter subunit G [Cereibacter sp. SYSU M97828]|nr:monovalent cation/H(+) antiporter subunit G [Cereibacter flavus]